MSTVIIVSCFCFTTSYSCRIVDLIVNFYLFSVCTVAKNLNENVKKVVGKVLDERLTYYTSSLLLKKIKANRGEITHEVAKILSKLSNPPCKDDCTTCSPRRVSYSDIDSEVEEENDEEHEGREKHTKVEEGSTDEAKQDKPDQKEKTSSSSEKNNDCTLPKVKKEEEEEVVDHIAKVKSIHENAPSLRSLIGLENDDEEEDGFQTEQVDHIAKVKSIHEESPSLREMLGLHGNDKENVIGSDSNVWSNSKKIGNCSTSFTVLELEKWTAAIVKGESDNDDIQELSVPIQFQTFISIDILKHQEMMNLDTTGTMTGMYF